METLPIEIQDKIILPKYYKLNNNNNNLTLNEKLILGHNLNKLKTISEQVKSLHDEYLYKKKHTHFSLLKSMYFPRFILMKNLSKKKNRSVKNNIKLYSTIIQLYCNNTYINNTYINNNITYNPHIYTENNINQNNINQNNINQNNINQNNINQNNINQNNIISYNHFNNITTYIN